MRFWVIGCTAAILAMAGCGDKGSESAATSGGPLTKLLIDDTKVGTGPGAKNGDTLLMEYTGKLADGTVFDSTSKRDDAPFPVVLGTGSVIKGWDQGLVGMKEGGQRKLSIPAALAYGASPPGAGIPPNADLFFDVKLDKLEQEADANDNLVVIHKNGTGPKSKPGDTVTVKYKGYFVNGKTFDPGNAPLPVKVGAGSVVPGFDKVLENTQKGEIFTVTIPPRWGYGGQANGAIPANSWLVFDIEVLSITK